MLKGIAALILLYVLWDVGYSFAVDKPAPPDETTGVAVEHMVHFRGVRYVDVVMVTNYRPNPVEVAVLDIDGEPVSEGGVVTDWRPISLSFLASGYLIHLTKHDWKMPEAQEVYLKPGQTFTVSGKRSLKISNINVLLDGERQQFLFDEESPPQ